MKYTVFGFNQSIMLGLGLDVIDAAILRWFLDWHGTQRMSFFEKPGEQERYYWVRYSKILEDLPLIGFKSVESVRRRFQDLRKKKVLLHHHKLDEEGSRSYFRFRPEVIESLLAGGSGSEYRGGRDQNTEGVGIRIPSKDSSIKDSSIKDSKKSEVSDGPRRGKKFDHESEQYQLAKYLSDVISEHNDDYIPPSEATLQKWSVDMDRLVRIDGRMAAAVREKIDLVFKDKFWKNKILSAGKLRERWREGKLNRLKPAPHVARGEELEELLRKERREEEKKLTISQRVAL